MRLPTLYCISVFVLDKIPFRIMNYVWHLFFGRLSDTSDAMVSRTQYYLVRILISKKLTKRDRISHQYTYTLRLDDSMEVEMDVLSRI